MEIAELVTGLGDSRREVRYGAGKTLIELSAREPARVYPYFDVIAERMRGRDRIIGWNATRIIANLCAADHEHRIDSMLEALLAPLNGPELVAAATALGAMGRIAAARPDLAPRLAAAALSVGRSRFKTPECRLVVIGHALNALGGLLPLLPDTKPVQDFARSQIRARRPQVRQSARSLLARLIHDSDFRAPARPPAPSSPTAPKSSRAHCSREGSPGRPGEAAAGSSTCPDNG